MNSCENIHCIVPIRKFESFYYTITKSYFGNSKLNQKKLNEAWEHWRHKVVDYLILKNRYPKNFHIVKFEDLTKRPLKIFKILLKKLDIREHTSQFKVSILVKRLKVIHHFLRRIKNKFGIYKAKYQNKLDKVELPKEYKKILNYIDKFSII